MDSTHLVSKVTQRMVSVFDPQAIYLFGSRAWGQPTEDSAKILRDGKKVYVSPVTG